MVLSCPPAARLQFAEDRRLPAIHKAPTRCKPSKETRTGAQNEPLRPTINQSTDRTRRTLDTQSHAAQTAVRCPRCKTANRQSFPRHKTPISTFRRIKKGREYHAYFLVPNRSGLRCRPTKNPSLLCYPTKKSQPKKPSTLNNERGLAGCHSYDYARSERSESFRLRRRRNLQPRFSRWRARFHALPMYRASTQLISRYNNNNNSRRRRPTSHSLGQ